MDPLPPLHCLQYQANPSFTACHSAALPYAADQGPLELYLGATAHTDLECVEMTCVCACAAPTLAAAYLGTVTLRTG